MKTNKSTINYQDKKGKKDYFYQKNRMKNRSI